MKLESLQADLNALNDEEVNDEVDFAKKMIVKCRLAVENPTNK